MQKKSGRNDLLLQVKNLRTSFQINGKAIPVVRDVSLKVKRGEVLGLIGESGCGKSVTSLSLMRLIPKPHGKIEAGEVWLEDTELLSLTPSQFRPYRGRELAMIFQDPMTSLNPVLTIGQQISEVLVRQGLKGAQIQARAQDLLEQVGLSDPKERLKAFPHQLSGGMKQRVMIAMALSGEPKLLIADEPTTALDVTIQAQILNLLAEISRERGMSLLLITHDLGVVAQACDRVMVMYAGAVVEEAEVRELFKNPRHPYTQGLMRSIQSLVDPKVKRLAVIEGMVPNLGEYPTGCPFQSRCPLVAEECRLQEPSLIPVGEEHQAACHFAGGNHE